MIWGIEIEVHGLGRYKIIGPLRGTIPLNAKPFIVVSIFFSIIQYNPVESYIPLYLDPQGQKPCARIIRFKEIPPRTSHKTLSGCLIQQFQTPETMNFLCGAPPFKVRSGKAVILCPHKTLKNNPKAPKPQNT